MFDWIFGNPPANRCSRQVYVRSSRRSEVRLFTVYGDTEVCAIRALKEVEAQLSRPEPGEEVEIKTYLG